MRERLRLYVIDRLGGPISAEEPNVPFTWFERTAWVVLGLTVVEIAALVWPR